MVCDNVIVGCTVVIGIGFEATECGEVAIRQQYRGVWLLPLDSSQ